MYESISGLSVLFPPSIYLSLSHCLDYYSLKINLKSHLNLAPLFFSFKVILAVIGALYSQMNFRNSLSISEKKTYRYILLDFDYECIKSICIQKTHWEN